MSIINQMLKDLEVRNKSATQSEAVIDGLQSLPLRQKKSTRQYWLLLGIMAFIAVWAWDFKYYFLAQQQTVSVAKKPSILASSVIPASAGMTEGVKTPEALAAVTGVSMQVHGKMTFLRFLLDREVSYQVNSEPVMHSITLHIKNARLGVNIPPMDYAGSALSNIKIYPEEKDGLNIILMMQANAKLSNLELNKESKFPELQADFLLENHATKKENRQQVENISETKQGALKKIAVELTVDEQYQDTLNVIEAGETGKAILKLSALLDHYPEYPAVRATLINLYLQQGAQAKAERLLAVGLQKSPNDPALVEVKAHILVNQGKVDQALKLLKKAPPALATHPEYYAFIAALYQRVGHLAAAESLYQQLTMDHPEKGVWWLGLGITEEGLGKSAQALEAYAKAGNSPDLDPELRGFVETKLRG